MAPPHDQPPTPPADPPRADRPDIAGDTGNPGDTGNTGNAGDADLPDASPDGLPASSAEIEVVGQVEVRSLGAGSKSEHRGAVLVADDGSVWSLRRQGGPAFGDARLAALAGRRIRAFGRIRTRLLLLRHWVVLD